MNGLLKRFGLLAFYAVALAAAGWFLAAKLESARAELEAERAAAFAGVRTELSRDMLTAQAFVELLQTTVQNELSYRPQSPQNSVLLNGLTEDSEGVFSLDTLPPGIDKASIGNLTGFGGLKGKGDYFKKELEVAFSLRSIFVRIVETLPNVAWTYYVSGSRFEHVYPWVPSTQAAYKDNDLKMEYFQLGMPENNTGRTPYTTDVYDDDFGKGLMITMGRPVYDGDKFTGIVALDFTLRSLDGVVAKFPATFGEVYLVDHNKQVIGYSKRTDGTRKITLPADGAALVDQALADKAVHAGQNQSQIITAQTIEALPFVLMSFTQKSATTLQVAKRSVIEMVIFLVVLSLLAFLEWRRRVAGQLEEARDQAEEATRAKSSFLAMMSHEIRTPMNGVMSMAEMLDQTDLTEDQRSMSSVIRSSASALLAIINDILDFSKIEAGKLDIEKTPFSLLEVVESAAELMSQRADDKGLTLTTVVDPKLPDALVGDPARVRQILLNLVGNALKFTETGGVRVDVTPAVLGAGAGAVRFAVTDTGIGLTPEQQGRLFQAFAQADVSTARKYGGTGLGLSISQRLCELMHGRIGVTSAAGKGSTFWFELPFSTGTPAAGTLPPIEDAQVVLVDFGDAAAAAMGAHLAAYGIAAPHRMSSDAAAIPENRVVFLAATGADALVIGHALIEQAKSCKFVLVAPRGLASTLSEADRAGFFATVTLPLRRHRVGLVIAAALGRADLGDRTQAGDANAKFVPPPVEEARAAGVLILVAEDNATNQLVISRMLGQRGYACEIANNGAEALAKFEANTGYGLLLTDFHMPEMDGFTLTAEIRKREQAGARLPIVALTADALPGTAQRCLDAGMDGYLSKPIDSKALTATLEQWLPGAAALRRAAHLPKATARPAIDPQIFDLGRFVDTFGPVSRETVDVLGQFLTDARAHAVAVVASLDGGDSAQARHHAHALKGSAGSVGAVRLAQLAGEVQDCLDAGDADTAQLFVGGLETTVEELAQAVESLKP